MKHFIPLHHDTTTSPYHNNQGNWNGRNNRGNRRGRGNRHNRGNQHFNRRYRPENDIDYDAIDSHVLATEVDSSYPWPSPQSFYSSPKGQFRNSRHSSDEDCSGPANRNDLKRQHSEHPNRSFQADTFYSRRSAEQYSSPLRDSSVTNRELYPRRDPQHSFKRSDNWPSSPKRRRPPEHEEDEEPYRKRNFHNGPSYNSKHQYMDEREKARYYGGGNRKETYPNQSTPLSRGQSLVNMSQKRLYENSNRSRQNPSIPHNNYYSERRLTYSEQQRRKADELEHDRSSTFYDSEGRSASGSEKNGYSPIERFDGELNSKQSYPHDSTWSEGQTSTPNPRYCDGNRSSNLRLTENRQFPYNEKSSDAKHWPEMGSPSSSGSAKSAGRPVATIKGFKNFANTCYINSVLQALFGIPMVVKALLEFDKQFNDSLQDGVLSTVLRLLKERSQNPKRADSFEPLLRRVKEAVVKKTKSFEGSAMQDAHEFLVKLLDCLRDDSDHLSKSGSNPVDHNFKYELKEMYTCNQCGHVVTSKQPNNIISLNLRRVRNLLSVQSLQDVIEYNFQKESVQYDCSKCGHKVSSRSVVFEQLPRVLILHLKRYRQRTGKDLAKTDMALHIPPFVTLYHQAGKSVPSPKLPRHFCKETPPMNASHTQRVCPISKRLFSVGDKENQGPDEEADLGAHPLNWPLSEGKCDARVSIQPAIALGPVVGLKGGQPQLCTTKHSNIVDTTPKNINLAEEESPHDRSMEEKFAEVPQTEEEEEEWLKRALQQSLQDVPVEPRMNGGKPMGTSDSSATLDAEDDIEDIDLDLTESQKKLLRRNCQSGELNHSYHLRAVVAHKGSMECGHFLTYVCHEQDKWWHFSDENVTEVTDSVVSEKTERSGYIVLYTYKST